MLSATKQALKRDYICPYCFEKHPLYRVSFICQNDECVVKNGGAQSGFNIEKNIVAATEPTNIFSKLITKMPSDAQCGECGTNATVKACPSCKEELPTTIGDFEDLIFAVVGAKETGKSHYISVLINQLKKEVGEAYDAILEPLNDDTIQRYREEFWNPVFKKRETIDATRSGTGKGASVQRPLLYTLKFFKKGAMQKTKIHKVITLAFFDTAGEDLNEEDTMNKVNKYIYNSAGVILLLDPLQLDHVRDNLRGKIELPTQMTDSDEILFRMTNLIRHATSIKQDKKITIPLAVAFSKIDAVEPLLDPASPLRFPSKHGETKAFDNMDFQNVQSDIQGLIRDWSESGMNRILQANYDAYGYFGVSSLGYNPDEDNKIKDLKPYRVADPFLWLLAEHNIIDKTK